MEGGGVSARPYISLYVLNRYREPCDRGNEHVEIKQKTNSYRWYVPLRTRTPHTYTPVDPTLHSPSFSRLDLFVSKKCVIYFPPRRRRGARWW